MSPILDQYGRQIPGSKTREIKRLAGSAFPDLLQRIKDTVNSLGTKGQDLLKNFNKAPEPPKTSSLRTAMTTKGNQPSPLNFNPLRAAQFISNAVRDVPGAALGTAATSIAVPVAMQTAGKPGVAKMSRFAIGVKDPLNANAPIYDFSPEPVSSPYERTGEDLITTILMRKELDQARAAQLARAERRPGVDQQTPPQIVPDDPIAPPVEPTAPIDYMGALGAEMKPASPSTDIDDLKARYRAALLDTNVNSMQALRNAEDVLGIEYAQGKYYFDSGSVDANGNPIPVELKDEQRRQLKNFEITPTELQLQGQLSDNPKIIEQLLDNEEIYDETVGSNATKMPEYPLFTGESPADSSEKFDFADVAAAMSDLGISFLDYHRDLPNIKFKY